MSTYALTIAQKVFDLLRGVGSFATYRQTPMLIVGESDLPSLGVYIARETWDADGDENAGEPHFLHKLSLAVTGAINISDSTAALMELEQIMAEITDGLLTNVSFIALVQGVLSVDRRSQYSKVGEITLAEIQITFVVTFRSYWPPVVTDDFNVLHVETRFPDFTTDPNAVQQLITEYEINQNPPAPGSGLAMDLEDFRNLFTLML